MNRRDFINNVAATSAIAALGSTVLRGETTFTVPHDWLLVDGSENSLLTDNLLDELRAVGVTCCTYNPLSRDTEGLGLASKMLSFLDQRGDKAFLARTVSDIREAKRLGKIAFIVGWQSSDAIAGDAGYFGPWETNPTHTFLRAYYELGLRICAICYNLANRFGGGNLDPTVPLTRAGHLLVEEIHRLRILLDIGGHTGEQTSLDAIAMAPGVPVICTHTNVAAITDNPRNVSDRVIDAIASTGGVIGVSAVSDFNARSRRDAAIPTTPQSKLEVMLDHCDYIRKRVGIDHVGLGPDFTQGEESFSIDPSKSQLFPPEMASRQGPIMYVKGFENISQLPNLIAAVSRRGWPEADIRKLLGENWLRVYKQAWGS
jgi:membrane dipeptidase